MADDRRAEGPTGEQLIEAVQNVSGTHPGHRVLHANAIGATGVFRSSGGAAALTTAAHLQAGAETPVVVRMSNGTGDPDQPDTVRDGHGFAVRFRLADGSSTDLVTLTLPTFFVRTAEDFIEFMTARIPDPATGQPDLDKIIAFLGEHPEAQPAIERSMGAPFPASFTDLPYYGVHAFWFVDADGTRRKIRYRWDPDAPSAMLDDTADLSPHYLRDELRQRLGEGPATFHLRIIIGTDDDDETDPTVAWPDDRDELDAGTVQLLQCPDDQEAIEQLIFDPTRVTTGIECSDDAILHARARAYGVSYSLRTT